MVYDLLVTQGLGYLNDSLLQLLNSLLVRVLQTGAKLNQRPDEFHSVRMLFCLFNLDFFHLIGQSFGASLFPLLKFI